MTMGYYGTNNGNPPIQFDDAGNIYYAATLPLQGSMPASTLTLRKYVNGSITNLVNENMILRDFIVLGDGTVVISGTTSSTTTSWVRKISPSGSLTSLVSGASANFIRRFADGNVYIGIPSTPAASGGVRRYVTATNALDPRFWIGSGAKTSTGESAYFDTMSVCQYAGSNGYAKYPGFCMSVGAMVAASFNVGTSDTYVVAGQRGTFGTHLMRYYPTVDAIPTKVANITLAQQVGTKLILAGTNAESVNTLTVIDTTTFQETVIIDLSNEVEIYNLSYISATNRIMFNGLRFSDNKFVIGEVDMP
jgi:hypothetical protein